MTESRGSEGVRYILLSLAASLGFFLLLSKNVFFPPNFIFDSSVRSEEKILVIILAISVLPIFGWALRKYDYFSWRLHNILIALLFIGLVAVFYKYFQNNDYLSTEVSLLASFSLFLSYSAVYLLFKPLWQKNFQRAVSLERWFFILFISFVGVIFSFFLDFSVWWYSLLLIMYTVVIFQGLFALYLMLYTWENKNAAKENNPQKSFLPPQYSFTAIVPCKHEMNTIADTIKAMHAIKYPASKKQIIVVIHEGTDDGTIGIVKSTIKSLNARNIKLVTYNESPINKPHGLNKALEESTGDYVAIFDAEDEPHPDLFSVVNTSLISSKADVVQSGVQLMNFHSNWYSTFNVLEYYFWFKSSLHFYAKNKVMPLGGVSVFFRRHMLEQVGGWDLNCLTEDAEIGIRLSLAGAKMSVIYDAEYATREETPPDVVSFIKQRTRWAQGFLQILSRKSFLYFPTFKQKFLAAYILSWPLIIPFVFLLLPFAIVMMFFITVPPALAVLSNISLLIFLSFIILEIIGFYEFVTEYKLKFKVSNILVLVFLFYPYTLLLTIASIRAVYRNLSNITVWEKTEHKNVHRQTAGVITGRETVTATAKS